ncbi:MAG: hypothetical protein KKC25_02085 [Proteobacteria bacterium]|nr:hypothetical protein [Pseudomonadota bacterium]
MFNTKVVPETHLNLTVHPGLIPFFFPFLQQGVVLKVRVGCSVKTFLLEALRLSEEYIERRIQTVFLDGQSVDDLDRVTVRNGAVLALSGALPGLLGAALRRGGFYAPLRSQVTCKQNEESQAIEKGQVTLKLFNLTVRELGPSLLERGIGIGAREAEDFFRDRSDDFWAGCRRALVDGRAVEPDRLRHWSWGAGRVDLTLKAV